MEKRIVLGSASPRRQELLTQIGVEFEVRISDKDEVYVSTVPEEIVKELALMKAENVASELEKESADGRLRNTVVIGADTVVVLDGEILGKPENEEDAVSMLSRLQGRGHDVYTGVAVLGYDADGKKQTLSYSVGTAVYVNPMTEGEIRGYVGTKEPLDKAGAYGIQGRFAAFIDRIDGDYYNVVGLPVSRVRRTLKEMQAI